MVTPSLNKLTRRSRTNRQGPNRGAFFAINRYIVRNRRKLPLRADAFAFVHKPCRSRNRRLNGVFRNKRTTHIFDSIRHRRPSSFAQHTPRPTRSIRRPLPRNQSRDGRYIFHNSRRRNVSRAYRLRINKRTKPNRQNGTTNRTHGFLHETSRDQRATALHWARYYSSSRETSRRLSNKIMSNKT